MPTYNNISVTPNSGTGNKSLTISASPNTGRNDRSAGFSLRGTGNYSGTSSSNSLIVTQSGAGSQFLITTNASTNAFPAAGGTITYTGTSNLATLTLGSSTLDALLTSAMINEVQVTKTQLQSGYSIPNDPGKTLAYPITIEFTIPENTSTSSAVTYTGSIGGQALTVVQSAAGVSLSFSRNSVTVNADGETIVGEAVTVNAPSGTSWEIVVDA